MATRTHLSTIAALAFAVGMAAPNTSAGGPDREWAAVRPGRVIWRGHVDGLDDRPGEPVFELAPDGRSFLYLQGLPWPRLMVQPIPDRLDPDDDPAAGEPRMVGTQAPFGHRTPRFDPTGRRVYFTADTGWRPRRPPRRGDSEENPLVRAAVVEVDVDDGSEQRLAPIGPVANAFAIFLDLHPGGDRLLVGIGANLHRKEAEEYAFDVELAEVPADGGPPRKLGFEIPGHAPARYSADGEAIYYARPSGGDSSAGVHRLDLARGLHRSMQLGVYEAGHRSGRFELTPALLPHLGSFGFDAYPVHFLRRSLDRPGVAVEFGADFPLTDRGGLHPKTIVRDRILLRGGPARRPELIVAALDDATLRTELDRVERTPQIALDASSAAARSTTALRAAANGEAKDLLDRVRRTVVGDSRKPVPAVRVRWKHTRIAAGGETTRDVEVLETADGLVRVETRTPPENPEDAPRRELLLFDGERGDYIADGMPDGAMTLALDVVRRELNSLSPYHLLLDPCGLSLAGIEFSRTRLVGPRAETAPVLEFRHVSGYHGRVRLQVEGDRVVPDNIITPRFLASWGTRVNLGRQDSDKKVTFSDYRPVGGRQVPHRIVFDDGVETTSLEVVELELEPEVDRAVFRAR